MERNIYKEEIVTNLTNYLKQTFGIVTPSEFTHTKNLMQLEAYYYLTKAYPLILMSTAYDIINEVIDIYPLT